MNATPEILVQLLEGLYPRNRHTHSGISEGDAETPDMRVFVYGDVTVWVAERSSDRAESD